MAHIFFYGEDNKVNLIEEQERREEINTALDLYPVPTKYHDLQRASERQALRNISMTVAVGVILLALVWFFWG